MEDVSDPPFRAVCKENGADMMYTEFISAEGLIRDADKSVQKLDIYDYERPIGIQIFGDKIESMREAAAIAEHAHPEIIDINYGCPVKKVACKGAGAGILLDLPKMQAMTSEIVKRVNKPVTVKTRLGWDENSIKIEEVAMRLQDVGVQALTIHGRTRKQMYKGEANWSLIAKVKDEIKHFMATGNELRPPSISERVDVAKRHLIFSLEWKGDRLGIFEMRRHYTNYFKKIPDFKSYRTRLVETDEPALVLAILDEIKSQFSEISLV